MAGVGFIEFSRQVRAGTSKLVEQKTRGRIRDVVRVFLREVSAKTPVDTGLLKGNHRIGINTVREIVLSRFATPNTDFVEEELRKLSKWKLGNIVVYTNSVYYFFFVNDGTEGRQGRHMVEAALERARGLGVGVRSNI